MTVQNRIFFTYLYLDNTTGMTHLKITYSEVEICSYESVTSALNVAPSSDIFAPGKKNSGIYWIGDHASRSARDTKQKVFFFPPENTIPILQTVAFPRRLGGCLCPRIGLGVVVNRQAAFKYRTPIFLAPIVTLGTELSQHTRMKSNGSLWNTM